MVSTIYSIAQALQVEIADLFAVPEGYQHYSVRNNSGVGQTEKGAEEQTEAEKDTDSDTTEVQQTVDGSGAELKAMFCPKCGTKFFVEM